MTKLLITGGSGFIGGNLAVMASERWDTSVTFNSSFICQNNLLQTLKLDITDKKSTIKLVEEISPQVIIHTAAVTNFNFCYQNKKKAEEVNVSGTENISLAAEKIKARLIYTSSDLVFSGNKAFYSENDIPDPICHYGKTKLMGENIVKSICSDYCIARISLVYGKSLTPSKCFTEEIIEKLREGKEINLFIDEYRTPINIKNLCEITLALANRHELRGLFHLCGNERVSRFEFGLMLADVFGFDRNLIKPVSVENYFEDTRPKDCSMINKKIVDAINPRICNLSEGLEDIKKHSNA